VTMGTTEQTTDVEPVRTEREEALLRLKKRRDFQGHLITYVVVNVALWAVWAATGAGYAWPAWITGGWGIGLILNAWDVFFRSPISEADVQHEINRLHPQH
jgi:2TM domain